MHVPTAVLPSCINEQDDCKAFRQYDDQMSNLDHGFSVLMQVATQE